jgi:hypothetical protein
VMGFFFLFEGLQKETHIKKIWNINKSTSIYYISTTGCHLNLKKKNYNTLIIDIKI